MGCSSRRATPTRSRAADRMLDDAQLAERLATAGRERAASFDWSIVLPAIEDVYARALQAGPASLR